MKLASSRDASASLRESNEQTAPEPRPSLLQRAEAEVERLKENLAEVRSRRDQHVAEQTEIKVRLRSPENIGADEVEQLVARQALVDRLLGVIRREEVRTDGEFQRARQNLHALHRELEHLETQKQDLEFHLSPKGRVGRLECTAREAAAIAQRHREDVERKLQSTGARMKEIAMRTA